MIVAEYLAALFAVFNSTAETFTGTGSLSSGFDLELNAPTAITIANRSTVLTATILNGFFFIRLLPCFSHQIHLGFFDSTTLVGRI
jgi:hypothetical protein